MRILYITTIGMTMNFFKDIVKQLIEDGNKVDIACNEDDFMVDTFYRDLGCNIYNISLLRIPFSKNNLTAIKEIKKIVLENGYDIVHCHTPVAGICTRLACRKLRKKGLKVFYTAHGFHFYKGAPFKNWLLYYPAEKLCSRFTDTLITINKEDYSFAKKKMKAKHIEYVPGVGIDVDKFKNSVVDFNTKRKELQIPENACLLLSVGELNSNKNHQVVIRAIAQVNDKNIHYIIAGRGMLHDYLKGYAAQNGVSDRVHLLGFRNDVAELYKISDIYVLPSKREGLNVSVMEAMASGLPVICGKIRGNNDLVDEGENGLFAQPDNYMEYSLAIKELSCNPNLREKLGKSSEKKANSFSNKVINKMIKSFYEM